MIINFESKQSVDDRRSNTAMAGSRKASPPKQAQFVFPSNQDIANSMKNGKTKEQAIADFQAFIETPNVPSDAYLLSMEKVPDWDRHHGIDRFLNRLKTRI